MVSVWDAKEQLPARDATDISSELRNEDTDRGIVSTLQGTISTGKVFVLGMLSVTTLETLWRMLSVDLSLYRKLCWSILITSGLISTVIILRGICAGNFILGCKHDSVDIGD